MAKVIEQTVVIKFSRMVKNNNDADTVLTNEVLATLLESIPELCEQIVDDSAVVVELDFDPAE
jgi:hypothetical protein